MNEYTWTSDDVKLVERFIELKNKGYYCDGKQLTDVYNRILHKQVGTTNCGSCLRQRVNELEAALNRFKQQLSVSEAQKEAEVENVPVDENKENPEPKKRPGRPRKNV